MRMGRHQLELVCCDILQTICRIFFRCMLTRLPFLAVRVRPPLRPTDPGYDLIPQRFQRPMVQVTSPTSLAIDSPQGKKIFVFDRVFSEDVDQEGIWDYLVESTNAFIQGYNVSMLAYGQSGAGKSFTMGTSGPIEQDKPEIMGEFENVTLSWHQSATQHSMVCAKREIN
jgi:hypothetical protein